MTKDEQKILESLAEENRELRADLRREKILNDLLHTTKFGIKEVLCEWGDDGDDELLIMDILDIKHTKKGMVITVK